MGQVDVEVVVSVGGLLQVAGYVRASPHVGHLLGAGDVAVVGDTAVFVHLQEVVVVHGLHLVLLANVAGKEAGVEVGGGLVGVVATAVEVVNVEAESQALVGIDREVGFEALFAVHLAAGLVVGQVGVGNVAVGEVHLVGAQPEAGERLQEEGYVVACGALVEVARLPGRAQVSQVVVVSFHAFHEVGVLEVEVGRVGGYDGAFAQRLAQLPHVEFGGQAFNVGAVGQAVGLCRRVNGVPVLVSLGHLGGSLIEYSLCLHGQYSHQQEYICSYKSSHN